MAETSLEHFKQALSSGLRSFFADYEESLMELLRGLNEKNHLRTTGITEESVAGLQKVFENSNAALSLINNFDRIFVSDPKKTENNIKKLGEAGWRIENRTDLANQYLIVLSLTYHANLERLKNHFLTFILWDEIVTDSSKIHGIGGFLTELEKLFQNNKFLGYFKSTNRNSIAHFTFFWENNKIYFLRNLFDKNPSSMTLVEFMKEVRHINVLVEGFLIAYYDFVGMPPIKNFKTA